MPRAKWPWAVPIVCRRLRDRIRGVGFRGRFLTRWGQKMFSAAGMKNTPAIRWHYKIVLTRPLCEGVSSGKAAASIAFCPSPAAAAVFNSCLPARAFRVPLGNIVSGIVVFGARNCLGRATVIAAKL